MGEQKAARRGGGEGGGRGDGLASATARRAAGHHPHPHRAPARRSAELLCAADKLTVDTAALEKAVADAEATSAPADIVSKAKAKLAEATAAQGKRGTAAKAMAAAASAAVSSPLDADLAKLKSLIGEAGDHHGDAHCCHQRVRDRRDDQLRAAAAKRVGEGRGGRCDGVPAAEG